MEEPRLRCTACKLYWIFQCEGSAPLTLTLLRVNYTPQPLIHGLLLHSILAIYDTKILTGENKGYISSYDILNM